MKNVADAEPVNACIFPVQQFFPTDIIGIGLQGYFRATIDIEMLPDGGNNAQQLLRFQQGRGAAAEIDRLYPFAAEIIFLQRNLFQ